MTFSPADKEAIRKAAGWKLAAVPPDVRPLMRYSVARRMAKARRDKVRAEILADA